MDRRDQLKLVLMVMSMTSCVAYSYGIFKLPTSSLFRRKLGTYEEKPKDYRTDGGTVSRSIKKMDLRVTDKVDMLRNSKEVRS